jgi:hypothetical protein
MKSYRQRKENHLGPLFSRDIIRGDINIWIEDRVQKLTYYALIRRGKLQQIQAGLNFGSSLSSFGKLQQIQIQAGRRMWKNFSMAFFHRNGNNPRSRIHGILKILQGEVDRRTKPKKTKRRKQNA